MTLSATRIKTYLTCPRQFRYIYVDELPRTLTTPLAFGQVMHETLKQMYHQAMLTDQPIDLPTGILLFYRLWLKILQQEPMFSDEMTEEEYFDLAVEMLEDYVQQHRSEPLPLAVELPFEIDWRGHRLTGIIDCITESSSGLNLIEFKTSKRKPSPKLLRDDLQLTIYAFALDQVFDYPVEVITYYHLRDQTELITFRDHHDYQSLCEQVLPTVIKGVEAKQFGPKYGYWCRFCEFQNRCYEEGPFALIAL